MDRYYAQIVGVAEDLWHRHHDTDEHVANELAWALSSLGMVQARRGLVGDADETFRLSVQFLEDRVDAGTADPQDIGDLPLLLTNYAGFLQESGSLGEALGVRHRALDAQARALRRHDNVDEGWVRASLLIDYAGTALEVGLEAEARGAIEQAQGWLDLAQEQRPMTVAAYRGDIVALDL